MALSEHYFEGIASCFSLQPLQCYASGDLHVLQLLIQLLDRSLHLINGRGIHDFAIEFIQACLVSPDFLQQQFSMSVCLFAFMASSVINPTNLWTIWGLR